MSEVRGIRSTEIGGKTIDEDGQEERLIELVVVIAVITIPAGLFLPALAAAKAKTQSTRCASVICGRSAWRCGRRRRKKQDHPQGP